MLNIVLLTGISFPWSRRGLCIGHGDKNSSSDQEGNKSTAEGVHCNIDVVLFEDN